jgi:ribosome biogenesis GTPase / thiamine phosphate phosphatase
MWQVRTEEGETVDAVLRGRLKKADGGLRPDGSRRRNTDKVESLKLAVGDEVSLERGARDDAWAITSIEPRRSQLARREPGGRRGERVVAANIDQAVIVFAAARPDPHPRMLDRFLVIAEGNDLKPRVVINKVELVGEEIAREMFDPYARAGYPVHYTSVKADKGLVDLREAMNGLVSVLSGPSGVGKSSLLNAMFPGLDLRVGEISESVNKGRHTTVGASMHPLPEPASGFVMDTPGLREVGMWGLPPSHLDQCFAEFRPLIDECRFRDCTHRAEPGCAVRDNVGAAVAPERFESYLKLLEELEDEQKRWQYR